MWSISACPQPEVEGLRTFPFVEQHQEPPAGGSRAQHYRLADVPFRSTRERLSQLQKYSPGLATSCWAPKQTSTLFPQEAESSWDWSAPKMQFPAPGPRHRAAPEHELGLCRGAARCSHPVPNQAGRGYRTQLAVSIEGNVPKSRPQVLRPSLKP